MVLYLDTNFTDDRIEDACDGEECVFGLINIVRDVMFIWQLHYPRRIKLRWDKYKFS